MRSVSLFLSLALASAVAHADWTRIDAPSADASLYVDRSTAEKSGPEMVKLWHVVDYASAQDYDGKPYRSLKLNYEYDCSKSVYREWLRVFHKEPMGGGLTVYWTHGPGPWIKPEEGSIDAALVAGSCGAK